MVENADNACGAGQGPQGPQNGVGLTGLSSLDISQFESDHPGKLNSPAVMLRELPCRDRLAKSLPRVHILPPQLKREESLRRSFGRLPENSGGHAGGFRL